MRVSAIVSMPPTLLATALVAGHAKHHGLADMAVQWALVLIGTALLINVVASAWAILRERETSATGDRRHLYVAAATRRPPASEVVDKPSAATKLSTTQAKGD